MVTDRLADILWTPSPDGDENLIKEGVVPEKIQRVGNIMIDSLEMLQPVIERQGTAEQLGLEKGAYGLVTLHRPSNVDNQSELKKICEALKSISKKYPCCFRFIPGHKKI